jgi:putative membrane protein
MKMGSIAGTVALVCCGLAGCAAPPTPAAVDAAFLDDAARQDLLEIRLGELAQRYAQLPDVVDYGIRMVADHDRDLAALRQLAAAHGTALPSAPDDGQTDFYLQLSHISGDDFHRQYMDHELWAKRGEIDMARREAQAGGDAALMAFARDREPQIAGESRLGVDVEVRNHLNVPLTGAGGSTR